MKKSDDIKKVVNDKKKTIDEIYSEVEKIQTKIKFRAFGKVSVSTTSELPL